ncbi:hypothetical protein O6H91_01G158000 [Diphasiastrum complanatum]|uniref:Uncharacterized protein n=1 Tax=Diphasiastrum complanatum TaxID=34168 RepID=A0ACC2EXM9_DIPCM|nr:hypothetical protein O6H91_01G158000 [Diphasiastrum complanatum]
MLTKSTVAREIRLNKNWQDLYRKRAKELLSGSKRVGAPFTVRIVGRAGVGKGSLVNHLLLSYSATVSHNISGNDEVEKVYNISGLRVLDIPGYDGTHANAAQHGGKDGKLSLEQFAKAYNIFENETSAVIFVVNNRITPQDKDLMSMAVDARKFFCVVRTYADNIARIRDPKHQEKRLNEMEESIRKELSLTTNLNIRIFVVSIGWPEYSVVGEELQGEDLEEVEDNRNSLQFPLLRSYLSEQKGLSDELQIHSFVKEEIWKVLSPFQTVTMWYQTLDFFEHLAVGTFVPVAGPIALSFSKTLYYTLKAIGEVGILEDPDGAILTLKKHTHKTALIMHSASRGGLVTAVHEALVEIFGEVIFEIAIADLVVTAAEATVSQAIPLLGPLLSATHLPSQYRKLANKLASKACMLHELWIMQNITNLINVA